MKISRFVFIFFLCVPLHLSAVTADEANSSMHGVFRDLFSFFSFLFGSRYGITDSSVNSGGVSCGARHKHNNPRDGDVPDKISTSVKPLDSEKERNSAGESMDTSFSEMDSKMSDITDIPCDDTIMLKDITHQQQTYTTNYDMELKKVLCVELRSVVGSGYIWNMIGVHDREPTIDPKKFPTEQRLIKDYSSDAIIVTQPKEINHKKFEKPDMKNEGGRDSPSSNAFVPPLLGGSTIVVSKVKPLKAGVYYIVYAFYRPFNVTESPETRILILNVH